MPLEPILDGTHTLHQVVLHPICSPNRLNVMNTAECSCQVVLVVAPLAYPVNTHPSCNRSRPYAHSLCEEMHTASPERAGQTVRIFMTVRIHILGLDHSVRIQLILVVPLICLSTHVRPQI